MARADEAASYPVVAADPRSLDCVSARGPETGSPW